MFAICYSAAVIISRLRHYVFADIAVYASAAARLPPRAIIFSPLH